MSLNHRSIMKVILILLTFISVFLAYICSLVHQLFQRLNNRRDLQQNQAPNG
jgi:hypothetical protein